MTPKGLLSQARTLLLGILLWGGPAHGQETADTLAVPAAEQDSLRLDAAIDSLGITPVDSLLADSALNDSLMMMTFDPSAAVRQKMRRQEGFVPDPARALWIGLVFPGGGQIYNRKFWKLPVFYGGFLGCMYALTWNGQMLRDYTQAYLDIMDDDPDTKSYEDMLPMGYSIEGKEERFQTIFKNKKDRYRKYRDLSIFAFIAVYALSIVDAYVDAELSTFDISRDLSLNLEPAIINTHTSLCSHTSSKAYGVQMSLNF